MIPLEMSLTFFSIYLMIAPVSGSSLFLNLRAEGNGGLLH